jgi:transcriptional regulator with XRE-family HTH domain
VSLPGRWVALGRRLQAGRAAQHRSQQWVAARLGVTQASVGRHERGDRRPSREHLAIYATVLGIDLVDLLVLAEYVSPAPPGVD